MAAAGMLPTARRTATSSVLKVSSDPKWETSATRECIVSFGSHVECPNCFELERRDLPPYADPELEARSIAHFAGLKARTRLRYVTSYYLRNGTKMTIENVGMISTTR